MVDTKQDLNSGKTEVEKLRKELDEFAYIISHDLQAPLRGITGLLKIIEDKVSDHIQDEDDKELFQLVNDSAEKMRALIMGLLYFSRETRDSDDIDSLDVSEVLKEQIAEMELDEKVNIHLGDLPKLKFSKSKLKNIFKHLINNAIQYNDNEEIQINIASKEADDRYIFSVEDNGKGIEEKFFDQVFQLYRTAGNVTTNENVGIGLSIVKKIIETNAGEVWLESNLGQGSKFYFSIKKD